VVGVVALLLSGPENVIYSWWEGQDNMVLIGFLLLLAEFDFGAEGEAEEENLFSACYAGDISELLVDESMKISLESLISKEFFGGVFFRTEVDYLNNPYGC